MRSRLSSLIRFRCGAAGDPPARVAAHGRRAYDVDPFFESDPMRPAIRNLMLLTGVSLALSGGAAHAFTCYVLFDRNDNVVYRDTVSPVDLSEQGAPAREAMRKRGEYVMISEADRCPQVSFVFGQAGSSALSMEDFLGAVRPDTRAGSATPPRARGTPGASTATPARPSSSGK